MSLSLLFLVAVTGAGPSLVLKGLDPIELIQGREAMGDPQHRATYLRHEYRFVSKANAERFRRDPVRYAVQNGGACGKMGELTGKGSPERWAVANGKIFLFASDGCRTTFLANQPDYFRALPAAASATIADRSEAKKRWLDLRRAHGGEALDRVKQVAWLREVEYTDQGQRKIWNTWHAFRSMRELAQWEKWDAGMVFFARKGRLDREGKVGEVFGLHPGESRALSARFARHPAGILLGGAEAVKPQGEGILMRSGDIWFSVTPNPETGRIRFVEFEDRYQGPVAKVRVEYSDEQTMDGVMLPKSWRVRVNGGNWGQTNSITRYELNGPMPEPLTVAFGD